MGPEKTKVNGSSPHVEEIKMGNRYCCVPGCLMKVSEFNGCKISYHRFPRDSNTAKKWVEMIFGDTEPPFNLKGYLVCSLHFKTEERGISTHCYPPRYYLAHGAMPTIFPNSPEWMTNIEADTLPKRVATIPPYEGPGMELQRWPPDVKITTSSINDLFICALCNGYFYNATTITECLHTFCKSCLVKHVDRSLHCPVCKILIHPTDPFVNMKPDSTMQDILYKLLPEIEKDALKKEEEFYVGRGLPWPPKDASKSCGGDNEETGSDNIPPEARFAAIMLDYAGASPGLEYSEPLQKHYLWIPQSTSIGHIQSFLWKKLKLPRHIQPHVFLGMNLLMESATVAQILKCFFTESPMDVDIEGDLEKPQNLSEDDSNEESDDFNEEEDVLELQYGLAKKDTLLPQ